MRIPPRARVEDLLADLTAAGSSAATERKRAELMLASWEAPESVDQAAPDPAARARAEALLAELGAAGRNAGVERKRAEDLLASLIAAQSEALARRRAAELKRTKQMMSTVKGWTETAPAASEAEMEAPSPEPPESNAAPTATAQLAALPDQAAASDAARGMPDDEALSPEDKAANLATVERLLQKRREVFEASLDAYVIENWSVEVNLPYNYGKHWRLLDFAVIGHGDDGYKVRVTFQRQLTIWPYEVTARRGTVTLRLDGEAFEIVGHEAWTDEGREQVAALPSQPELPAAVETSDTASLEAVERSLSEREEELREALHAYNMRIGIEIPQTAWVTARTIRIWETEVLGVQNGVYKIRILFEPAGLSGVDGRYSAAINPIMFLKIDGERIEIVGHEEEPSGEGRGQQTSSPADLAAVERLLGEREEELQERLQAYLDAHPKLYDWSRPRVVRIGGAKTLSHDGDTYEVRLQFELPYDNGVIMGRRINKTTETKFLTLFLKLDGNKFRIVGHGLPGDEPRGQAAARPVPVEFEPVEPSFGGT